MTPRRCSKCHKPVATFRVYGVLRYYTLCRQHRNEYQVEWKRDSVDAPPGWRRSAVAYKHQPPAGMTRITVDTAAGTVTLHRGMWVREATLDCPERWQEIVRFYLHTGYHLANERGTRLVLERQQS